MFVKPAPDRMIRWPRTYAPLRAEGEHVPDHDPYWLRALADEDIVEAKPPAADNADAAAAMAPTPTHESAEVPV